VRNISIILIEELSELETKMKFKLVENGDTYYRDNEIQISITGIKNTSNQLKVPMKLVFWYMINHEICHARHNVGKPLKKRRITIRKKFDEYIRKYPIDEMDCFEKPTNGLEKRLYDDALAGLTKQIDDLKNQFNKNGFIDVTVPTEHRL
jgi:hypothetical protein